MSDVIVILGDAELPWNMVAASELPGVGHASVCVYHRERVDRERDGVYSSWRPEGSEVRSGIGRIPSHWKLNLEVAF